MTRYLANDALEEAFGLTLHTKERTMILIISHPECPERAWLSSMKRHGELGYRTYWCVMEELEGDFPAYYSQVAKSRTVAAWFSSEHEARDYMDELYVSNCGRRPEVTA